MNHLRFEDCLSIFNCCLYYVFLLYKLQNTALFLNNIKLLRLQYHELQFTYVDIVHNAIFGFTTIFTQYT